MKSVLIVGSKGQDGRLLSQKLLNEGHRVYGLTRETLEGPAQFGHGLSPNILSFDFVRNLVQELEPDEIYYLAAFHHSSEEEVESEVHLWQASIETHQIGLTHFLESIRLYSPRTRIFFAASSHIFGNPETEPQNEMTPYLPITPYGVTKVAAMHSCRSYRTRFGVYASCGILYTHESEFRSAKFLAKKIVRTAVEIQKGKKTALTIGDLNAQVDWGYASDFIDAFALILSLPVADDFVIATGVKRKVQEFVESTFKFLGLNWTDHVTVNSNLLARRMSSLVGDPSKLREKTGWHPKTEFNEMIRQLILAEGGVIETR